MQTMDLTGEWEIVQRPLSAGPGDYGDIETIGATLIGAVPGDVSDDLVGAGLRPEPLTGLNFRRFRDVEESSWWYRKRFPVPEEPEPYERAELLLDGLDVHADIWLNGQYLGHHDSAFYPFVRDVTDGLCHGHDNVLVVRVTTGREYAAAEADFPYDHVPTEAARGYPERGFPQRVHLRKPAFVWGWDWAPHLPTCGITGRAELRFVEKAEIRDVKLATTSIEHATAVVAACVELEWNTLMESAYATIELTLTDERGETTRVRKDDAFIASGINCVSMELTLPDARLWWPNGSGRQHLYTATVRAEVNEVTAESAPVRFGVRTVELDASPGRFRFLINGQPVFMKGGNWIPCDSLYGRISDSKVTRLVEEAAQAHFNCLRIWGGGRYEKEAFYDACDRLGILVWQDFMSACAPLPDHHPWFVDAFRREARHQIRRLRNRACLLLWCGNNEVSGLRHGWTLYHRLLPRMVQELSPHIPYWPTSPYGGRESSNACEVGDAHHWIVMSPEKKFWSDPFYWDSPERPIFNSEYGYGGPCCLKSTRQYLGDEQPDLFGEAGRQHTNTFYDIPRVNWSIAEHYRSPDGLTLEDYILLGGLCQGLNLGYSLESLRANDQTMGALFWMYNDAWGENGWSIIDYYLRRKVAFYGVQRALAPCKLVLRRGGQAFGGQPDQVLLIALNDTDRPLEGAVRCGFMAYDGSVDETEEVRIGLAPREKALLACMAVPDREQLATGTVMALPENLPELDAVSWKHGRFRDLSFAGSPPRIVRLRNDHAHLYVTVACDTYAHAVHFPISGQWRLSDHYFDLLPGQEKTICIEQGATLDASTLQPRAVFPPEMQRHA